MKSLCKLLLLGLAFAISATSHAAPKGEVLVLLSSETELPLQDGKTLPTGYYLNEFGVPADALLRAGYQLTVATPKGNQPKADPRSICGFHDTWTPSPRSFGHSFHAHLDT